MHFDFLAVEPWLVGLLFLAILGLAIKSVAADARRRGKSPVLVILLLLFFFPIGPIVWLLFRPKPLDGHRLP